MDAAKLARFERIDDVPQIVPIRYVALAIDDDGVSARHVADGQVAGRARDPLRIEEEPEISLDSSDFSRGACKTFLELSVKTEFSVALSVFTVVFCAGWRTFANSLRKMIEVEED